jgi:hypothetical protein
MKLRTNRNEKCIQNFSLRTCSEEITWRYRYRLEDSIEMNLKEIDMAKDGASEHLHLIKVLKCFDRLGDCWFLKKGCAL